MMRPRSTIVSILTTAALLAGAAGCLNKGPSQPPGAKVMRPPKPPPAYAPAKSVPIDPALRAQASNLLSDAGNDSDPLVRAHAIEGMRDSEGLAARKEIVRGLSDHAPVVQFAAAVAVGELKLSEAREVLLEMHADGKTPRNVQVAIVFALHRLGDARFSHQLEKFAVDKEVSVRANTVMVLGLLGEPSASKILRPMLGDSKAIVRLGAAEALWRLGSEEGLDDLVGGTVSAYPDDQMVALLALASRRDTRVIQHCRSELTSEYPEVALVAARACGMLASDEGYGVALIGAKSGDARQRQLAALAFGAIGRPDAQPILAPLLNDPNSDVRVAAATAILQLHS